MNKEEIINTRKAGLGSSDARMVYKIAKNGRLSDADRQRIAIMLGIEEKPEFSTQATEYGNFIEQKIFEIIKNKYADAVSNPYYISRNISGRYGFDVFNHIDYEVETDDKIIWIENKATKKSFDKAMDEYDEQLSWHRMLLIEKAIYSMKKPTLMFSHYKTDEYSETFDPDNFRIEPIGYDRYYQKQTENMFFNGLSIISEEIKDFKYEKRESIYADNLPIPLQEKMQTIAECFRQISDAEKQIEDFKEKMLQLMQNANVKSIQTDYFKINLIGETIAASFDSRLFQKENPGLAQKYLRQSKRNSYITIKTY